jgi:hypothetical protein
VPVTIVPTDLSDSAGTNWKWKVTAAAEGPVELVFNVRLTGQAGDQALDKTVSLMKSVRAEPEPDPWWENLRAPILYLTPFLIFAAAAIALREKFRKKKSLADNDVDPPDLES